MKLIFDTSIWVDHLRVGTLDSVLPSLRGRFWVWIDAVAIGELLAGARTKREREMVTTIIRPFEKAQRIVCPETGDFTRAGLALGRLRMRGRTIRHPGGALLDALTAAVCVRLGAVLVTANLSDFRMLAEEIPLRVEPLQALT